MKPRKVIKNYKIPKPLIKYINADYYNIDYSAYDNMYIKTYDISIEELRKELNWGILKKPTKIN